MRKPRLLLVDDEVHFTTNMMKVLSRRGYDVSAVNDGDSALRLIEEQDFDVVILDQKMPGKDGITTLGELKGIRPHLEVIMLTGYATVDSAVAGMRLGAYDYIKKPANLEDLEGKIGKAFQRKLMHEETMKSILEITDSHQPYPQSESASIHPLKHDLPLEGDHKGQRCYRAKKLATVGSLAAGVAHELNNPLTAIVGFAEGLRRQVYRLQAHGGQEVMGHIVEYTDIICKESQRCLGIVQSLLFFSRQTVSDCISVDLNDVVTQTVALLQNRLKEYPENHIRLDLTGSLPTVRGDLSQLKQVVLNLLLNALDATQGGGGIAVNTFTGGNSHVGLAVEDTGCGIPAENLNRLFLPLFTTKPPGQGTGISLSTCFNIVRNHGGDIIACSQEGIGSSFVVVLPREERSC